MMLTRAEEDKFIEDGSAKIEDIISATSFDDVFAKFKECISRLEKIGLNTFNEISQEDFTDPTDDAEVDFILPLFVEPKDEVDDGSTQLCLIFNYSKVDDLYSIFADVDFFVDDMYEALKVEEDE